MKKPPFEIALLWTLAACITFSAIGCGPPMKRAYRKGCKVQKKCNRATFDKNYVSISHCMEDWKDDQKDLEAYYGEACTTDIAKAAICIDNQYLKDCNPSSAELDNKCGSKMDKATDSCGYDIFSYVNPGADSSDDYY